MNFIVKPQYNNNEKCKIIKHYLKIINKYTNLYINLECKKQKPVCTNCKQLTEFDITNNNTSICMNCGITKEIFCYTSSYKDTERANISSKYMYDRKVHFRDCINQYQGFSPYIILFTPFLLFKFIII